MTHARSAAPTVTNVPEYSHLYQARSNESVGNTYGLRTWIEYGFKHAKNDLGWADYRVTDYPSIERWWELVFCTYSLVSFQCLTKPPCPEREERPKADEATPVYHFPEHPSWDSGQSWKNMLNNLRLVLQPYVSYCLLLEMNISPIESPMPHPYSKGKSNEGFPHGSLRLF